MNFKEYLIQPLNENRKNTVILGDKYDSIVVQSPHGSVPFEQKLKVPGMGFEDKDREKNKSKQKIIKDANDKVNSAYTKLEKEIEKILKDAANSINKVQ